MSKSFKVALMAIAGAIAIFFAVKAYVDHQAHERWKKQESFILERNERMKEQAKILVSVFRTCGFIRLGQDDTQVCKGETCVVVYVSDSWKQCWTDEATAGLENILRTRTFRFKKHDYLKVIEQSSSKILLEYSIDGMKNFIKQG